ncbi:GH116 family glycosyl-hydrolase [Pedobacter kyonggii]|uniref:Glycosyl-hydrolase family 116 catalytic region domain-containing protein n=1 Tax=Pedobacter kyonggii TaxID=1926871 RepID=A0A4V6MTX5_9SPHI|nr:GH116 family glycosyl-hydrolase [Pedobacter kyonggii]TBO44441.1 hypothetical protein EYS08_03805 [Pedobacter kyonggii]
MKFISLLVLGTLITATLNAQEVDYGADQANKRNIPAPNLLGGRTDYDYLSLKDHPSLSGVPLGGIGVGNVQFAPNGRFVRIGMNNIHVPIPRSSAAFFALWSNNSKGTSARRLVIDSAAQYGMKGVAHTTFTGLFPQATLSPGENDSGVKTSIHAWSSLIPHDVKNSSLPVSFFEVTLKASEKGEYAIAFAWEDFIGRGIKEPKSLEGLEGQILAKGQLMNGEAWPEMKAVQTYSDAYEVAGYNGIRQFSGSEIIPLKATFQNYVSQVAILAQQGKGRISSLGAFDIQNGAEQWASFVQTGLFDGARAGVLSTPGKNRSASAVSVKASLEKGETKTFRFMLVWYYPELKIDKKTAPPGSYWGGGSDYGRYFHNYFSSLSSLAEYSIKNREMLLEKTQEWQKPVMNATYPDWYKFKLINSGYVIYTNMILNKKGDVTVNEGGMGGLAGTMDQRISSHPFYQKFFTKLDRSEMEIFGDAQAFDGSINHFIGHYYGGLGTVGGRVPTENHWMLDNTEGWIIQIAKDYEQTADTAYLKRWSARIKDGMKFLKSKMPPGVEIPVGPTTYDDFSHPPIYSYGAGMYLASLKAAAVIARALEDNAWEQECTAQFERTQKDVLRMLWNGRFFAYGCEIDGTGRKDNILFTGQLAGQFISRYCGWGDIFPLQVTQASLVSQFKISLSKTPDYYANKVWDINLGHGIDLKGSQCWPFYLESYTGYPALQAGYTQDGMDIMKHIQLVHLRKGLTWSQNLWNPGNITYMTAPVTWFSTDVLLGAGLNLPKGELRLAPISLGDAVTVQPLFFPDFWANVRIDRKKKTVFLEILKTFGAKNLSLSKLVIEVAGESADARKVHSFPLFQIREGQQLNLTPFYTELLSEKKQPAVLPVADKTEFKLWNLK